MTEPRVALVTGARKGIGRHLVEHLLALGWHVAGCSRKSSDLEHPDYRHYEADVGDEKGAKAVFRRVRKDMGRLDALINNAGIAGMNHALLTPVDAVERIMRTNVVGTFLYAREAAKMMQKTGGRIVNFSTVAVPLALEGEAAYAASKAAVESLTRVLAKELGPMGITVNAVGPTPVDTDLIRGVPEEKIHALVARQAIGRLGRYEDVTN
ncbi:MAG: SDR family oxidoreductase, partial [Gemmatimonadetes bacterium]|nr:SDR family oxidoreductase [Gemmatimonadota bacterium]